jgi:hypothetical protein
MPLAPVFSSLILHLSSTGAMAVWLEDWLAWGAADTKASAS